MNLTCEWSLPDPFFPQADTRVVCCFVTQRKGSSHALCFLCSSVYHKKVLILISLVTTSIVPVMCHQSLFLGPLTWISSEFPSVTDCLIKQEQLLVFLSDLISSWFYIFFSSLSCCCCQKLNLDLLLNSSSYPLHNHKRFIPNHQNYLPHFNTGSQDFLGFHEFLWPEYDEFPSLSSLWRTSKNHRYHSWMEAITFHLSQGSGQHLVSISLLVSLWYPQLVCSLLTYMKYRFWTWLCVCVLCRQSVPTLFACCSPTIVRTSWLVALVPSSPCVPSSMSGTEER